MQQPYQNQQQNPYNNYPNQQNFNYPTAVPNDQGQTQQNQVPQQYGQPQQNQIPQYYPQQNQVPQQYPQQNYAYPQPQFVSPQPFGFQQMPPMKLPRTADGVRFPVEIECQYCQRNTKTRIEYKSGSNVCCWSCVLFFTFPILACVPCCIDDQKDVYHYCTQCNHQVGFTEKKLCK